MDTEEMYRRGVADAERGEVHPFYYQHYYHYRRGYDRAYRRLRRPAPWEQGGSWRPWVALAAALALAAAVFAGLRLGPRQDVGARLPRAPSTTLSATSPPPRTPLFPTPTSAPTVPQLALALRVGGAALVVNTEGAALLARQSPSRAAPVQASFPPNTRVQVAEGPVESDSYVWWRLEAGDASGWSAERSPEGVVWLQPVE